MGWNYRALRKILNEFEPRKTYVLNISELKSLKRGECTAEDAVKAVRRAARNMNAEIRVQGNKIYVKLRPSCSCTA